MSGFRKETLAEGVELYLGDCLEVLPTLGRFDAVVTDPPYGVGFKYASHNDRSEGYDEWCAEWFAVLRDMTPTIAVSCGISNITKWPEPNWVLCWHKPASMGRCPVGFNNWEPVLLYGKAIGQVVDVFRAPIITSEDVSGHPCPKPIAWAEGVISRVCESGLVVLDPFMGSGTTGVAAVKLGRRFTGIEIDPGYFDIACRRIEAALREPDMFIAPPAPAKQTSLDLDIEAAT